MWPQLTSSYMKDSHRQAMLNSATRHNSAKARPMFHIAPRYHSGQLWIRGSRKTRCHGMGSIWYKNSLRQMTRLSDIGIQCGWAFPSGKSANSLHSLSATPSSLRPIRHSGSPIRHSGQFFGLGSQDPRENSGGFAGHLSFVFPKIHPSESNPPCGQSLRPGRRPHRCRGMESLFRKSSSRLRTIPRSASRIRCGRSSPPGSPALRCRGEQSHTLSKKRSRSQTIRRSVVAIHSGQSWRDGRKCESVQASAFTFQEGRQGPLYGVCLLHC